jgi:hypothetical protein
MPTVKATFSADISQFRQSLAQATTAVTAFDRTTGQVNTSLKRFGNEFSGANIQRQAETIAKAVADIGGASRLTESEIKRASATMTEALAKYKALGTEAPASVRNLANELKTLGTVSEKTSSALSGIGQSLLNGIGIGAGINIAQSVGAGLRELVSLGAQLSPIRTAFDNLSGGAVQAERKIEDMRGATRGLVSDFDLMQAANKGALLGLDAMGIDMSELALVATRLGRAMGQDASKSVDDLTTALSRQSPQILDNLGIKVSLTDANEKYARSIGKSADALTDEEKKLAFASAAMDAARAKAASLGETSLTTADQVARIGTSLENVVARIGAFGNESGVLSGAMGVLAGRIEETIALFDTMTERLADALPLVGQLSNAFGGLGGVLDATVAPGLKAINLSLEGTIRTLDKVRALREWLSGTLGDVQLPQAAGRDRQLGGGTFGQGARAQAWLADEEKRMQAAYIADQDAALRKIAEGAKTATDAADKLRAALDKLTGRDIIANAVTLATQIEKVGAQNIPTENVEGLAKQLMHARMMAQQLGRAIAEDVTRALNELAIPSKRIAGIESLLNINTIGYQSRDAIAGSQQRTGSNAGFGGLINSTNPTADMLIGLAPALTSGTVKVTQATKAWRTELQGVSQAFANLAQIAGPSFGGAARGIGLFVASLDAAEQLVTSIGKTISKTFDFGKSKTGQNIAAGLAAGLQGWQIGTDSGLSPGRAALAGGASGAAAGIPLAAATGGVSVAVGAIVGAASSYFGAQKAESELRRAKDLQAEILVAQYGSLDALLETVGQLGLSQQTFLERFYGEPKEFAKGVNDLSNALTREQKEAEKLAKSLTEVARVQGVLSRDQMTAITTVRPGGPAAGAVVEFARQQRGQAEAGIAQAIAALNAATVGGTKNLEQFDSTIGAVTGSLSALFGAAIKDGESAVSVLKRLAEPIKTLSELLKGGGLSGGAGFEQLRVLSEIASGADTGPLVEMASGLGSALAGLANTGLLSPDLFGDLANGIGDAYKQLELLGKGGLEAARLMQPGLQAIWQMIQDQPSRSRSRTGQASVRAMTMAALMATATRPRRLRAAALSRGRRRR